ncbi:MAG: hypothetical protein AB9846_02360 [Tenuifilaceae bacterium]
MRKLLTVIIALVSINSIAQENSFNSTIQSSGLIEKGNVLLRWAPSSIISWQRGNSFGYSVYRSTVLRDGKTLDNRDSILLGKFQPLPIERWEQFSDSNHFAVAAEAIYGKGFEVTTKSDNFFDMVNKSREQDSRFSMGLLCADQSFAVACMMGLGLVDSTVKNNEAYLYKIVANYSDSSSKQEIGYVVVDFDFGNFLPRPFGATSQVINNSVTIMVPYEPFKGIYNSFDLQRSYDGMSFQTIKDKSYYSLSTTPDDPKYNIYNDSVGSQSSTIYYRLRGRTPFDTFGPFSDTLSVKIKPSLNGEPWITDIKEIGNNKLIISWGTPDYKKDNLKGFMIYASKKYDGTYIDYQKSLSICEFYSATIDAPQNYYYFKVAAIDQFNRPYFSAPKLYQAIDSIPPLEPEGLVGSFDTTGIVRLKWKYGKEKDLLCYQMLFSVNAKSEYSLITKDFIYDSTFTSSFPTNMLSSDIYFKLVALDTRYNTSKSSEALKLIKPDKIPPSQPVIIYNTDSTGFVSVRIAPSSSSDVAIHYLCFLSETNSSTKTEIFKGIIKNDTTIIISQDYGKGTIYCIAEDISGRKSSSNKLTINRFDNLSNESFNALAKPMIDERLIELFWDKTKLSESTMIYRKDNINGYNLIATIDSQTGSYKDRNVIFNTNYNYKLVAFNKKGKAISKVVEVRYK